MVRDWCFLRGVSRPCLWPCELGKKVSGKSVEGTADNDDTKKGFLFDERNNISWSMNDKTGMAQRSEQRETEKEIEVCAQCHARRGPITESYQPGQPFADHYMVLLLDEDMYFSDGQIQDEVYVYGTFLQSKMYHLLILLICIVGRKMMLKQKKYYVKL